MEKNKPVINQPVDFMDDFGYCLILASVAEGRN